MLGLQKEYITLHPTLTNIAYIHDLYNIDRGQYLTNVI